MTMSALVLGVYDNRLLVRDSNTKQEVIVNLRRSCDLRAGDRVQILFGGIMTLSLPPQISAILVRKARFNGLL